LKRTPPLSAQTRTFALLGNPVAHSLSPAIHAAAMRHAGVDGVYVALRCESNDVKGLLLGLARAGGGGNVTVPHKGVAARIVEAPTRRVRATRACNTFWFRRGRVHGENTDAPAFAAALRNVAGEVRGSRALILGAGGAARSAVYALLEDGCDQIAILGRSGARAREIVQAAGKLRRRVVFTTKEADVRGEGFDVVINATPLGLRDRDRLPLRFEKLGGLTAVFDMVYKKGGTAWVRRARALGIPATDGGEMLVRQAAAAFELWFEQEAPIAVMRAAIA
jgi:shikimate dehydrogenase